MYNRTTIWLLALSMVAAVTFLACETGPPAPAVGSAEWYWSAANLNFALGDYEKTQEHLGNLIKNHSGWEERAMPWRLAVVGGLARGYLELSDAFADCATMNKRAAPDLQNPIQQYRRDARRHAIDFAESAGALTKMLAQKETAVLDFEFPTGRAAGSPLMENLTSGMPLRPDQVGQCEQDTLKRGVLMQVTEMAGAGGDVPKAQSLFAAGPVAVPRNQFLCVMGQSLLDISRIFNPRHTNETDKQMFMLDLAINGLESPLSCDDKEIKQKAEELKKDLEKERKKLMT